MALKMLEFSLHQIICDQAACKEEKSATQLSVPNTHSAIYTKTATDKTYADD